MQVLQASRVWMVNDKKRWTSHSSFCVHYEHRVYRQWTETLLSIMCISLHVAIWQVMQTERLMKQGKRGLEEESVTNLEKRETNHIAFMWLHVTIQMYIKYLESWRLQLHDISLEWVLRLAPLNAVSICLVFYSW